MARRQLGSAVVIAAVVAVAARATAQPEIEIEPGTGSGSGSGSGSATGSGSGSATGAGSGSGSATATGTATGSAEAPVKDPKLVKKWLAAAQQLVQKADALARANKAADAKPQYENAITAYTNAIDAGGEVTLFLSIAQIDEKLGDVASAYKHVKRVLDPQAGVKPDVAKKAQAKLDELAMKIAVVTLVVTPDGTQVTLDDKVIAEAPVAEPLVFNPGAYKLTLTAVGFQPKDVELKLEAGSETERKLALEPVPVVVRPVDHEPEPEEPKREPSMVPLYVGAGATGGLLLISMVTGIVAISQHGTYTDPATSKPDRLDAKENGRTNAHIADACLIGAIAAGAFTAYWYRYQWAPQQRASGHDHWLLVGPWVGPGTGGALATGSF